MKSICSKHDRAYEVSEGCPYCEKPQGAVAVLAQATPVAAATMRCSWPSGCGNEAAYRWRPITERAKATVARYGELLYCARHHAPHATSRYSADYDFEKIP